MSSEYDPSFFCDYPYVQRSAKAAYHLEGQPIAVAQAQEAGRLGAYVGTLESVSVVKEEGTTWIILQPEGIKLFSGDCNTELIPQLQPQSTITVIECSGEPRPDINFGREEVPVAAVFAGNGYENAVYVSPGFDLHRYRLVY